MNCYVFEHPQYGKLRMVERRDGKLRMVERRDGELYYYLEDVMRIFGSPEKVCGLSIQSC